MNLSKPFFLCAINEGSKETVWMPDSFLSLNNLERRTHSFCGIDSLA